MKEEKPYQFKTDASVNDIRLFKDSPLWRDMVKYITYRLEGNNILLRTDPDHRVILRSQGAAEVAQDILDLPDRMIEWAEEDQDLED